MEEIEERTTELKYVIIQISQCEPHRENRLERKEQGICGTTTDDATLMSEGLQ